MAEDIEDLLERIRPADAPDPDTVDDDPEAILAIAEQIAEGYRDFVKSMAESMHPGMPPMPAVDKLAEPTPPPEPRPLDLRGVEDIDTFGYQVDVAIAKLRELRDRVEWEREHRGGDR